MNAAYERYLERVLRKYTLLLARHARLRRVLLSAIADGISRPDLIRIITADMRLDAGAAADSDVVVVDRTHDPASRAPHLIDKAGGPEARRPIVHEAATRTYGDDS